MNSVEKTSLHPRNQHRLRYDFKALTQTLPELGPYVRLNDYGDESVDFANPKAVKMLNRAILKHFYGVNFWDIPENYLCPPIPGRADYIHHVADLFESPKNLRGLDIGVGANCVYPLIGHSEYGWSFVGLDIDPVSVKSASAIAQMNHLEDKILIRQQAHPENIFKGVIDPQEQFDFTMCNPPFHSSLDEAMQGSKRKWKNLGKKTTQTPVLNFGGQGAELWCEGGEARFIKRMVDESVNYSQQCKWFTTLVSKKENLNWVYLALQKVNPADVRTIEMGQGQKKSRMVAWTYRSQK